MPRPVDFPRRKLLRGRKLIASGYSNGEAAKELRVPESTLRYNLKKIGVRSKLRSGAVKDVVLLAQYIFWREHGFTGPQIAEVTGRHLGHVYRMMSRAKKVAETMPKA